MIKSKDKLRKGHIDDDFVREKTIAGKVDSVLQCKVEVNLEDIFKDIDDDEQKKVLMEHQGVGKAPCPSISVNSGHMGNCFRSTSWQFLLNCVTLSVRQ